MSKHTIKFTGAQIEEAAETTLPAISADEDFLPPINEGRRFFRVLFSRKLVVFGAIIIALTVICAVFAPVVAPYDPYVQNLKVVLAQPSAAYLLGTDAIGRDLLSRIIYGAQIALIIGVGTVFFSAVLGSVIGLIAGYAGGWIEVLVMRATDALMALPPIMLALLISAALGGGVRGVMIAVAISLLPGYIRLIAGQVLSLKQNDYITAEHSMGANQVRVMFKHLLPNCMSPLIVQMTMMMGLAILTEASLSFLSMGITPPTAAWGAMVYDGYRFLLKNPLLSIAPGLAIMLLVFAFNMVGDGLRDALDPKLRGAL
jgi:ABC-type dipeptide/oligopeptide/nickel transport system permease subunit